MKKFLLSPSGFSFCVRFSAVILLCLFASLIHAADRYWVAGSSSNWNNSANWSASSGGAGGASVPGATDVAIFDGAAGSNGTCTIDAAVSVAGLTMTSGYSGTIDQGAYSILIGNSGANLSGGNFSGGSEDITVNGHFAIAGTNFTSTTGTLTIGSTYNFAYTSGSFLHNNGTVLLHVRNNAITGNITFHHLTFSNTFGPFTYTINTGTTLTVNGTLSLAGNGTTWINTGTVEVKGNINISNTAGNGGGTATFLINGTGVQSITGTGGATPGKLPQVNINKTAGQLNLIGTIAAGNNWTYTSGTVDPGTSRMVFAENLTVTGSQTFNEVEFNAINGDYTITVASGTTVTATADVIISGTSSITINTGTVEVKRDLTVTNTGMYGGGTGVLLINGTTNQTVTGAGTANRGRLPRVTINKASGTLLLASVISVGNNWTYTTGTLDAGASRVVFAGELTIAGNHTLNEVDFSAVDFLAQSTFTIASGTTLTIPGHTYISGGTRAVVLNTGTIETKSDVTVTNTSEWTGGHATILINGTGTQTLTGSGVSSRGSLPRVHINKTSGTLNLASIISASNDWTYTTGTIVPGTSRVVFNNWLTISGTHTLNDIEISSATWGHTVTVASGTVVTAGGNFYLSSSRHLTINTGVIEVSGDVVVTNTGANGGGTATIRINGTGAQTFSSTSAAGQGKLPNIVINKTSGTLAMSGIVTVIGNWTFTDGTVDAGTSTVYFLNANNIDAEGTGSTMSFYDVTLGDNNLRTLSGNINISHVLALGTGRINLNGRTCYMAFSSPSAITRSTGYIVSELVNNSSKLSWNIGAATGSYVYPFSTTGGGAYIPFVFELTGGDAGIVTVSTYPTAGNNMPYPVTPDAVTNMTWSSNTDFSSSVVDRFWQIDKTGPTGTATITYTYAPAEVSGNVTGNQGILHAQRYNVSTNTWENPRVGQTADVAGYRVTEPGVTEFSPRMLAVHSMVVPVRLLSFTATLNQHKKVDVKWATATETANDHFVVERSVDGRMFEAVAKVKGGGNSGIVLHYAITDEKPLTANTYYRLKQVDVNGNVNYSRTVLVNSKNGASLVVNSISNGTVAGTVTGIGSKELIRVFDGGGRLVYQKGHDGFNRLELSTAGWSKGIYTITVAGEQSRFIVQ